MNPLRQIYRYFDVHDLYDLYGELNYEQRRVAKHKSGMKNAKNIVLFLYHKMLFNEATGRRDVYIDITEKKKLRIKGSHNIKSDG